MTMDPATLQQVRSAPLFAGLTDAQLECIEPGEVIEVPAGTVLVSEGERYPLFLCGSRRRSSHRARLMTIRRS